MSALLRMSAGLIGWAIAFSLLYGLHGIGCAAGWPGRVVAGMSLHRAILLAAWIASLAAGVAIAIMGRRDRAASLTGRTAWRIALVGLVATATTGLPILLVPACL